MNFSAKYDTIGKGYNNTRKADPYLFSRILHHLSEAAPESILDIGCGSGNYTSLFNKVGLNITGVDPSQHMLDLAASKAPQINWVLGSAESIPLTDQSFDAAIATLTLHHWNSLHHGFSELSRVLKPTGRIVVFTSTKSQMRGYWLNHYFPKMLQDSIEQMPAQEEIEQVLEASGFKIIKEEKYLVRDDLQDQFLYVGKNKPELYLNKNIRTGISSFSDLANADEITAGLMKLEADIDSGHILKIIKHYENALGDYLFLIAEKS